MAASIPISIEELQERLRAAAYFADRPLATAIYLALRLEKPLLLEGEAGVGKTEVAKVLATMLDRRLIRLQCYEGLDVHTAVYEWDYSRQMLEIRLMEAAGEVDREAAHREIFGWSYLLKRPLLEAISPREEESRTGAPVLLIDELDRADAEFEAFLLELLSDFQVSVPEIGTIRARQIPIVLITSNRTREVHDALRRRCLYHWIEYPPMDKELEIVRAKVPTAGDRLSRQVVAFVQALRQEALYKRPGVAETLDWVNALMGLDEKTLSAPAVRATLGVLLKYQDDIGHLDNEAIEQLVERAVAAD